LTVTSSNMSFFNVRYSVLVGCQICNTELYEILSPCTDTYLSLRRLSELAQYLLNLFSGEQDRIFPGDTGFLAVTVIDVSECNVR